MVLQKTNLLAADKVNRIDRVEWMIGFSKFLGSGTMNLAEAWPLFLGLEISVTLQIKRIEIEIDSQEIFNLVQKHGK